MIGLFEKAAAFLLVLALTTGATLGLKGCGAVSTTPPPGPLAQDLPGLVQAALLIIVGQVSDIQPGRTFTEGEAHLKFNDVHLNVEKRLKGEPSGAVVVEHLDTAGRPTTAEVGPPYKRDERYVLFLQRGEGERYVTVTQGRILLREGKLYPTERGPIADKVKGMKEAELIKRVEVIVQGSDR